MEPWDHIGLRCARVVTRQLRRGAECLTDEGEKRLVVERESPSAI
jgi:hypothetical protein